MRRHSFGICSQDRDPGKSDIPLIPCPLPLALGYFTMKFSCAGKKEQLPRKAAAHQSGKQMPICSEHSHFEGQRKEGKRWAWTQEGPLCSTLISKCKFLVPPTQRFNIGGWCKNRTLYKQPQEKWRSFRLSWPSCHFCDHSLYPPLSSRKDPSGELRGGQAGPLPMTLLHLSFCAFTNCWLPKVPRRTSGDSSKRGQMPRFQRSWGFQYLTFREVTLHLQS